MSKATKYLQLQSGALRQESESLRLAFKNSTNKGSGFEVILRNRIRTFIPPHWNALHGELVDSFGTETGQLDLAVVNGLHPRGPNDGRPEPIMFDGTVAVGEIKMKLTTEQCDKSLEISKVIRECKLHDENNNVLSDDIYARLKSPPFFLLALDSDVALNTLEEKLNNDLFYCVIVFSAKENKSAVAISDTPVSSKAIEFLKNIGELAEGTNRVFLIENPLLALSWLLATYAVPMAELTPIVPMYF